MTIELTVYIKGNETGFMVTYCPDSHSIEDVCIFAGVDKSPAEIDIDFLFATNGKEFIPLREALEASADQAFSEHQAEYAEMRAADAAEYRAGV